MRVMSDQSIRIRGQSFNNIIEWKILKDRNKKLIMLMVYILHYELKMKTDFAKV